MTMAVEANQTERAVIATGPSSPSSYGDDTLLVAASGNPDVSAPDDVHGVAGWAFANRCSRSVFDFAIMRFLGIAARCDEKEPDAASGDRCFMRPLQDVKVLASYSVTRLTLHSLGETIVFPCIGCAQLRDACVVATNARGILLCARCYNDLTYDKTREPHALGI